MVKNGGGGMPDGMKTVLGWVLGIAIIAFVLLIMAIIFGNLSGNVGFSRSVDSFDNQTITFLEAGSTPAGAQDRPAGVLTNVVVTNTTGAETLTNANYTISGTTIFAVSASTYKDLNVNVSYTVTYDGPGRANTQAIITNYTTSATNTSAQFPTVGTIIGIAILLLILIGLLIFSIRKLMGVANLGGGSGSFGGGSGGSGGFKGSSSIGIG